MARKSIADMIPDMDEPPAPDVPPPAPPADSAGVQTPNAKRRAPRRRPERSAPESGTGRSNPERSADGRPTARDLAAPARRSVAREALKADVPADLALIQRLHRYRLDHGVDIRDQVAIAVDEWLTAEGY
jgi:hypothetical protein